MDASFKQYTYSDGMDLQQAVPLDAAALISAAGQGAQVNEAEGWVQHLNTAALQGQLSAYQQRLKTYIDRQNGGQSTSARCWASAQRKSIPCPFLPLRCLMKSRPEYRRGFMVKLLFYQSVL